MEVSVHAFTRPRRVAILSTAMVFTAVVMVPSQARSDDGLIAAAPPQSVDRPSPPGTIPLEISPRTAPGVERPVPGAVGPNGLFKALQTRGVTPILLFVNQTLAAPGLGVEPGAVSNTGVIVIGADFGLDRIVGLKRTKIHILESIMVLNRNRTMQQKIGSGLAALEYYSVPVKNHLSVTTIEHQTESGLDVEVGKSNMQRYFTLPNCFNTTSCVSSVLAFDSYIPPPRFSNWMIRASAPVSHDLYVQGAVFQQRFTDFSNHGFRFGLSGGTGVFAIGEIGKKSDFRSDRYPGRYELGAYYNSSGHADPLYTTTGQFIPFDRTATKLQHPNNGGVFLFAQQVVSRADHGAVNNPDPPRLTVFGQYFHDFSPTVPYSDELAIGATVSNAFTFAAPNRLGFKIKALRSTSRERDFQDLARVAAGGPATRSSHMQYDFEVNSHLDVFGFAAIEPTAQYIKNPDSFFRPYIPERPKSGWLLGANITFFLSRLFGGLPPSS